MKKDSNRIKFAYYLPGWKYDGGDTSLFETARKIVPSEYQVEMEGEIFCPGCFTNLSKSPKDKPKFSNGRQACFMHWPSYSDIECDLRTPRAEGMLYPSEELAREAIEHGKLAIVHSFRDEPQINADSLEPYDQSAIEDIDGPVASVGISRHRGERFELPSTITTVAGICRKFDGNLNKYYVFPGHDTSKLLSDLLVNVEEITDIDDVPKLYFGVIESSFNAGINPKPTNLRMTALNCNKVVKDFYLKATAAQQEDKGINNDSKGRIVLFWGKIALNGIGLCVERLKWGEYALLPEKYNKFLIGA